MRSKIYQLPVITLISTITILTGQTQVFAAGPGNNYTDYQSEARLSDNTIHLQAKSNDGSGSFTKGFFHIGAIAGIMNKPVFYQYGFITPDQHPLCIGIKGGAFLPIRRVGFDLSTSFYRSTLKDFTQISHDYFNNNITAYYEDPVISYLTMDLGFHYQIAEGFPLSLFAIMSMGLKTYTSSFLNNDDFFYTESEDEKEKEFAPGFGLGARFFIAKRYAIQFEYRTYGAFQTITTTTTNSSGTSRDSETNSAFTGIVSLGFFVHLF